MRTTLTIDDDVLAAAKGLENLQHKSVGEVISALTRQALRPNAQKTKRATACHCYQCALGLLQSHQSW